MSELIPLRQRVNTALARSIIVPKRIRYPNLISDDLGGWQLITAVGSNDQDGVRIENDGGFGRMQRLVPVKIGVNYRIEYEHVNEIASAEVALDSISYQNSGGDLYSPGLISDVSRVHRAGNFVAITAEAYLVFRIIGGVQGEGTKFNKMVLREAPL